MPGAIAELLYFLVRVLWLVLPVIIGGIFQVVVIRGGLLRSWAWPLDRGRCVGGKRLFGDNKTFRGFVVMIVGTALGFGLEVLLAHRSGAVQRLGFVDYRDTIWWLHGSIYGAGYVLAELPNSWLKRRLDIGAGQKGTGALGILFLILDQVDGVFGVLATMCAFYVPTAAVALTAFVLLTFIHVVVFNVVLVLLGVKRRVF
jgi:hypothetical protein